MEHADFALYTVKVALHTDKGDQKKDYRIGLRTLTISRDKDEWGEEFYFQALKKEDIWNTEKECPWRSWKSSLPALAYGIAFRKGQENESVNFFKSGIKTQHLGRHQTAGGIRLPGGGR